MTRPQRTKRPRRHTGAAAAAPASRLTLLDAMRDPALFGTDLTDPSWVPWRRCAAAVFGLTAGLTPADRRFIERCLGRPSLPRGPAQEAWLIIGRRGGKSRFAALVAVFLACFRDYAAVLAPGERGVLMIIASDRHQARGVQQYVAGLLHDVPMLERLIVHETKEAIELSTRVTIEIHTASYRAIRGYTVVGAICDELAFWHTEGSANPDTEILNALRPAMATVPGALLVVISSPYARRGELWKAHRAHYGRDEGGVLVWQADTRTMNPTVPETFITQAYAKDAAVAAAEYGADFRRDIEAFVSPEAIDTATAPGRRELAPVAGVDYEGFVDPSGGSQDAMTGAVGHRDGDRAVLDAVWEVRPPFSPEAVVREFAHSFGAYRITRVRGDRYGGEWPREQFRKAGIEYEVCKPTKSDLYRDLLPALNSGRVELLDQPRLLAQLGGLERRTGRNGKEAIDHAPGGHDDLINAAAGVLVWVMATSGGMSPASIDNFCRTVVECPSLVEGRHPKPWHDG